MKTLSIQKFFFGIFVFFLAGGITPYPAHGGTTSYQYDTFRRLTKITDSKGNSTQYKYDARNNLISLTDAEGNTTSFEYNANDQVIKETRPMGEETNYTYNEYKYLATKTDAKNQRLEFKYDLLERLTDMKCYDETDRLVNEVSFIYSPAGNFTGYDDGISSATYVYDSWGRKTQETVYYGGFSKTFSYSYYKNSKKKSVTYPDGTSYEFSYDKANQLQSIIIPGEGIITYQYNWYRPSQILYPGGMKKTIEYGILMKISKITVTDPGQNIIMQYQYAYDSDKIFSIKTENSLSIFTYDSVGQLFTAGYSFRPSESFTYNRVGNRVSHRAGRLLIRSVYNANNELMQSGTENCFYDANGNLTRKVIAESTTTYVYNTENRLVQVTTPNGLTTQYTYDPFGRRIKKNINGIVGWYLYSDEGLIAEMDSSGNITKSYGWQPNSFWGTDPVWMKTAGQYHYFHTDYLAVPVKMALGNGAVTWSAQYSAFGKITINPTSTIENNLRYPGQYEDVETGLFYSWHRYYDPKIGRFITVDPVLFGGGDDNLYAYVWSSPLNYVDPWGLFGVGHGGINIGTPFPIYVPGPHETGKPYPIHNPRPVDDITKPFPLPPKPADVPPKQKIDDNITRPPPPSPGISTSDEGEKCPPSGEAKKPPARTPAKGKPNSKGTFPDGKGGKTDRIYGPDGKARKDIDYGHSHGKGDPHIHDWDWTKPNPRQPGRKSRPGEIP